MNGMMIRPWKSNMDTKNIALEKATLFEHVRFQGCNHHHHSCDIFFGGGKGHDKKLNCIFPIEYVIPKRLKFSHWPSKHLIDRKTFKNCNAFSNNATLSKLAVFYPCLAMPHHALPCQNTSVRVYLSIYQIFLRSVNEIILFKFISRNKVWYVSSWKLSHIPYQLAGTFKSMIFLGWDMFSPSLGRVHPRRLI